VKFRSGLVVLMPFCRKNRMSCIASFGFRSHVPRLFMWIEPEACASAMSRGKTFRRVYSVNVCVPALEIMLVAPCVSLESIRAVTSWTGMPRRVSLWRYSSCPFSMRMVFTTSLMRGAVRYLVFDFCRSFSVSLAVFFASSGGILASRISELAILFASNSSSVECDVRTSMPRGLRAFLSTLSAMSMTILPSSVRKYFFASGSASTRLAFRRNLRW